MRFDGRLGWAGGGWAISGLPAPLCDCETRISLNPKPSEISLSQSTTVVTVTPPSTTARFSLPSS
ncbi:hypothetical protein RchiOBHm_Chr3g0479321 [Rosa chinensis]|uniref:Uncharacterized protein n=1 Tax=Rosa chinensis TaxID=74649 RepID=A0A2P6RDD6_ROSCH|nr:hypothetical protein RchiOBHm_Chr3g0479321 [Rosa chinensis]